MFSRSRNVPRSRWHGEEWLSRVTPCDYLRADERRLNGANAPFQTPPLNREVGWKCVIADLSGPVRSKLGIPSPK
jgi:hypothetical protein